MTNYADVRKLLDAVERDHDRFEAFVKGYVEGAQDMDSDVTLHTADEFEERLRELYRKEFDGGFI